MKEHFVRLVVISLPIAVALFFLTAIYPPAIDRFVDTSAPEIEISLPLGYVHGTLAIDVVLRDESGAEVTGLVLDDKLIASARTLELDTARLTDGVHTLMIEAVDRSLRQNVSQRSFSFQTDNTPPRLTSPAEPFKVGQGRTLAIQFTSSEPVTLTGSLDGQNLSFTRSEARFWSVLGFGPDTKTGSRRLDVLAVDRAGLETRVQMPVTVSQVNYPTESLYIPEDRAGLLSPAIVEDEISYLDKVFAVSSPEKLWSGLFMVPVQGGETSSPFAIRRSYNGGPMGSHHGGMDLAIAEGVPVAAANRGRVAVAEPLKVRGNVVILDHGLGVYSAYYHLSAIKVQKDQMVDKGQTVGLVGNTGLSTGAHLHWEMRVTGAAVDPLEWTTRTMP